MNSHQRRIARRADQRNGTGPNLYPVYTQQYGRALRTPGKSRSDTLQTLGLMAEYAKRTGNAHDRDFPAGTVSVSLNIIGSVRWKFNGKRISFDALVAELIAE